MNKNFCLFLFSYLIIQVLSVIPEWNLTSVGEDLLGSYSEKTKIIYSRTLHNVNMVFKKKFEKHGTGIKVTNLLTLDGTEKEVDFDQIESFYHLFNKYIVCPKGSYHPYDFTNNKEIKPSESFKGEKWDLRCYYHFNTNFFLVFYLMNGKNINVYLTPTNEERWYDGASIDHNYGIKETYDFLLKSSLYSGDYQMIAIVNDNNVIKLEYLAFILNNAEQYPNSYLNRTIIEKNNYTQAYFRNNSEKNKDFYYFTYNNISDFKTGYSTTSINENNNYYFEIQNVIIQKNDIPHLEFFYKIEIEEMNFLLYNKFLYYKMKSQDGDKTYFGIFDIVLNKVIFNTKEQILEFIPYTDNSMLAITKNKVYKICAYKENNDCTDVCTNGYSLNINGNICGQSCPNDKYLFKPTDVCINTCDTNYYTISGNNCGLCRDIEETKPFRFVGGTECLSKKPDNSYFFNEDLGLLKCNSGFHYENNSCKEGECYELCEGCESYSTDADDQKCLSCINGFIYDANKKNCFCESGKKKVETSCERCSNYNSCKTYKTINLCDCETCFNGYSLKEGQCEQCSNYDICKTYKTINICDCEICIEGYSLNDNQCEKCSEENSCKTYKTNSCDCDSCNDGYYLNDNKCKKCDDSCKKCNIKDTNCTECYDYSFLENNKCYNCTECKEKLDSQTCKCNSCYEGFYLDLYQCKECEKDCKNCSKADECSVCNKFYYLNNSHCQKCPSDILCNTTIDNSCKCDSCNESYFLHNDECINCNNETQCKSFEDDIHCKCKECNDGFYINSFQCKECEKDCKECENANGCLICEQFYKLENSHCKECSSDILCNTTIDNSCKCASCNSSYYLYNGECIKCNNNVQCKTFKDDKKCECEECNDGFYKENYSCKQCNDTCLTCDGGFDGNLDYHCLSCKNGSEYPYLLIDDKKHICVKNCSDYNAITNTEKNICELPKDESDEGGQGGNGDGEADYMLWIFVSIIGILLILVSICICKRFICRKSSDDIELINEMEGELTEK